MRELISLVIYAIGAYFIFWNGYDLFLAISALFAKKSPKLRNEEAFFYIVIPAYKEGSVLINTIEAALAVDYPEDKREVVLLAQDLEPEILSTLSSYPITIVATGALGSKMKAIKNWMSSLVFQDEYIFIVDADNLVAKDALQQCSALLKEYEVVQLELKKTKPTTSMSVLDRWNTAVGITMAIHSRLALGLSTFILGSGFAAKANVYKKFLHDFPNTNVEDKALDLFLISNNIKMGYHRFPGVVDSTIGRSNELSAQRSRWVGGRIEARTLFRKAHLQDFWNLELFDKHVHYSSPQRSLRLVLSLLWAILPSMPIRTDIQLHFLPILLGSTAFFLATPKELLRWELIRAILALPKSILIIAKSRLLARNAAKEAFTVTPK